MREMRTSFISALSRIDQHIAQQDDAPKPAPVKREKSEGINRTSVSVKRKPADPIQDFPPLKFRKVESPETSSQTQPFRAEAIAHKHDMKPRPGPSDISGSSTDKVKRPVPTKLLSEKQPNSKIILAKGSHPPPLILTEKIESSEEYLSSQKLSRVVKARQLKFQSRVLGKGVYTADSIRPGAGKGLYAGMNFGAHALITECVGKMETVPAGARGNQLVWDIIGSNYESWSHLVEIADHQILKCIKEPVFGLGGGSFANDSRPDKPNSEFVRIKDEESNGYRVFVKSLRPVKAGEEITVSYGDGFWRSFKEVFPESYETIFGEELFNIDGLDERIQKAFANRRKQDIVKLLNRKKEVPKWDEFKVCHKQWNTALCLYALYKYHKIGADKLTPTVLNLLKPDSDHYFTALGEYVARQKGAAKSIVNNLRRAGSEKHLIELKAPVNDIFRKYFKELDTGHIYVFYRFFNQDRYFHQVGAKSTSNILMHILNRLNSEHPLYEQLLTEYIFRYLDTGFDQVINFNSKRVIDGLKDLRSTLFKTAPPVPETVCGEPFEFDNKWSTAVVKELLKRKGIQIIESNSHNYMSPYKKLDMLFKYNDESYQEGLLSLCRARGCNFSLIATSAVTSRTVSGIRFRPIPGVTYNEKLVNKDALFFQYIHYAGIDSQEVYEQATNETLYECIRIMGSKYKGVLSQSDLLAMALCNMAPRSTANKQSTDRVIDNVRDWLSGDLSALTNDELWLKLYSVGEALRTKYKELPRIATSDCPETPQ